MTAMAFSTIQPVFPPIVIALMVLGPLLAWLLSAWRSRIGRRLFAALLGAVSLATVAVIIVWDCGWLWDWLCFGI